MNLLYVKIAGGIVCILSIFFAGWHIRDVDFMAYKAEVKAEGQKQEAHNQAVEQQHKLINKGIQNEYEGKLAALRNYYGRVQFNPSSGPMSGISPAPKGTDAETAYPILAGQCAATTAQLTSLQDWVNAQIGIK
jgi:hypothetical protein